jgi:ankyrin repeat protein
MRAKTSISNFLAAADSGETAKIADCLDQGIKVNVADEHDQTALMVVAAQGHADTVRLLLQQGLVRLQIAEFLRSMWRNPLPT